MGKFAGKLAVKAKTTKGISSAKPDAINLAGGEAYALPFREKIATAVLNCMLNNKYYESAAGGLESLQALVEEGAKLGELKFVAQAALYARQVYGLRSVSHVIAGELGDQARGEPWKRPFYSAMVMRPDDILETLSYWNARHDGARHPNAMLRGFAEALVRFDAYALAKYKGDGKSVNLLDAVNLCHPRAPKEHPIHELITGKLKSADTWEKAISGSKGDEATKASEWERLLSEKKLGYLACLRNLRNIAEQAPKALEMALALITDEQAVLKSRVFPFQFRTAYDIGKGMGSPEGRKIQKAVARAADLALANVPKFEGKTLVVVDGSGSMQDGSIQQASPFAAALVKGLEDCDYMQFDTRAQYIALDTVGMGTFALAEKIEASAHGGGTDFNCIFEEARAVYRRVIILSDMQGWVNGGVQATFGRWAALTKKNTGKLPALYSFDLTGHGTSQFPAEQVALLAGFSEKIFTLMGLLEANKNAMIDAIAAQEFKAVAKGFKPKKIVEVDEEERTDG
jgi:hypothetical protein